MLMNRNKLWLGFYLDNNISCCCAIDLLYQEHPKPAALGPESINIIRSKVFRLPPGFPFIVIGNDDTVIDGLHKLIGIDDSLMEPACIPDAPVSNADIEYSILDVGSR